MLIIKKKQRLPKKKVKYNITGKLKGMKYEMNKPNIHLTISNHTGKNPLRFNMDINNNKCLRIHIGNSH